MIEPEEPIRVLGLRQVKTALLPSVQEDAPLPDVSQREVDQSDLNQTGEAHGSTYGTDIMSPAPLVRVIAQIDDDDLIGDEDSGYYDSDIE
jgi:hypothetical protein